MSAKYTPTGLEFVVGEFVAVEEQSPGGAQQWRIRTPRMANVVVKPDEAYDYADLLDEICEFMEEEEAAG